MYVYMSIKRLSQYLDIKPSTLYAWVEKGIIPHYRIQGCIRFRLDEIEEWLKSKRQGWDMTGGEVLSPQRKPAGNIDKIIRKAIDSAKGRRYISSTKGGGQTCSGPERR